MGTTTVNLQTRLKGATAPIALSIMLVAQPALAQDAEDAATATAADAPGSDEVIVVTGTRIARREFSLPNPVVTLSGEAIEQSGETNLTEFLADQPALIGSQTSTLSAGSNLLNAQQVGVNFLDLQAHVHADHRRVDAHGHHFAP